MAYIPTKNFNAIETNYVPIANLWEKQVPTYPDGYKPTMNFSSTETGYVPYMNLISFLVTYIYHVYIAKDTTVNSIYMAKDSTVDSIYMALGA